MRTRRVTPLRFAPHVRSVPHTSGLAGYPSVVRWFEREKRGRDSTAPVMTGSVLMRRRIVSRVRRGMTLCNSAHSPEWTFRGTRRNQAEETADASSGVRSRAATRVTRCPSDCAVSISSGVGASMSDSSRGMVDGP